MLKRTFKLIGTKKESRTHKILNYSPKQLKRYIEKLFTDGMSWNNYGEWHIDHIIPLSKGIEMFKDVGIYNKDEMARIINSLDNLQPLWEKDNLEKSNKLIY